MKTDIILAGVGGQGILSIAASIGAAAVNSGLFLKQAEVHGMSQRGGDVQSHLRISDKHIYSDLIPKGAADIILSVEPLECLRYVDMLSKSGWIITNNTPFVNIPDYPEIESVYAEIAKYKNHIIINADQIAKEAGSVKAANIVMLGAAVNYIDIPFPAFENAIKIIFEKKGEKIISLNLNALSAGKQAAEQYLSATK